MGVSFSQLVSRTAQQLQGYTKDQASISYLVAAMNATDVTFSVDPETVTNLSRGLIQIDDELMLVKKYDRASGVVTLFGGSSTNGRGVEGTTAASHALEALITDDPVFPRQRIKDAINDTIRGVYPDLWVFANTEFNYVAARYEYVLPSAAEDVYKVVVNTIGPSRVWFPAQKWRFNSQSSLSTSQSPSGATGKSLQLYDFVVPGRAVRVTYTKAPSVLVNNSDDFETVSGLPERTIDLITYGACWRLLPAYEAARLQQQNIEATERAPLVPPGSAVKASELFLSLYQKRLAEERDRLFRLFENYQSYSS